MNEDFLDQLGELALASRLKRLADKMLVDAASVYQHFGVSAQPKWFPLIALLDKKKQVSVVQAAKLLGLSQPAISQFSKQLESENFVTVQVSEQDSRKKYISLSAKGKAEVNKMRPMWDAVSKAAKQLSEHGDNNFYQSLVCFEKALHERSLQTRIMEQNSAK